MAGTFPSPNFEYIKSFSLLNSFAFCNGVYAGKSSRKLILISTKSFHVDVFICGDNSWSHWLVCVFKRYMSPAKDSLTLTLFTLHTRQIYSSGRWAVVKIFVVKNSLNRIEKWGKVLTNFHIRKLLIEVWIRARKHEMSNWIQLQALSLHPSSKKDGKETIFRSARWQFMVAPLATQSLSTLRC